MFTYSPLQYIWDSIGCERDIYCGVPITLIRGTCTYMNTVSFFFFLRSSPRSVSVHRGSGISVIPPRVRGGSGGDRDLNKLPLLSLHSRYISKRPWIAGTRPKAPNVTQNRPGHDDFPATTLDANQRFYAKPPEPTADLHTGLQSEQIMKCVLRPKQGHLLIPSFCHRKHKYEWGALILHAQA